MNTWRIYTTKIAPRRYQVKNCLEAGDSSQAILPVMVARFDHGDQLAILSSRPYQRGCIVNPSRIIRQLIEARKLNLAAASLLHPYGET